MLFIRGVSGTGAKGFLMLTRYKENINHTDCKNRQIFNLNKTYILLQRRLRVTECNCHWSQSIFHYWNSLLSKAHNEKAKRSLFLQEWIYCDPDNTVIYFATFLLFIHLFIYLFIFFFEYLIMLAVSLGIWVVWGAWPPEALTFDEPQKPVEHIWPLPPTYLIQYMTPPPVPRDFYSPPPHSTSPKQKEDPWI